MENQVTIDLQTRVVQVDDVLSSQVDDDLVLMSIENDQYYGMDSVSRRIWELVAEPRVVADVCDQLLSEYRVEPDTCQREVVTYIQQLADEQLVRVI
ncbi:PqqD family protein [Candidatus Entotheonella serta]|nr:PqqD family protein [Candidatus Entotheonella serta]